MVQLSHPHMITGKTIALTRQNFERKATTNLYSISKSRDITLPIKVHRVKALVFPGVMYGMSVGLKEH